MNSARPFLPRVLPAVPALYSRDLEPVTPRPPSSARLRGVRPVLHPLAGRTLPSPASHRREVMRHTGVRSSDDLGADTTPPRRFGGGAMVERGHYSPSATSLPTSRLTIEANGSNASPASSEPNSFSTRSGLPPRSSAASSMVSQ